MDRRIDPEERERNTDEELELLIEEKYREIERLEAQARSRYTETGEQVRRRRPEGREEARRERPRRPEGREETRRERPRRPEGYEETRRERPRRPEGREETRRERPRRPEGYEETRRERPRRPEGYEEASREQVRRRRSERYEEPRREQAKAKKTNPVPAPVPQMTETPKKEKSFLSEKIIRKVGGLIGVIIALLVVLVVFGGDFISGLIGTTKLASSEGVINILLVGQDGREEVEGSRSDSMMLVSVNKDTDQVKIISLMRDMYVSIPGHDDNRINASYSMGGIDLLTKTVEQNFQVKIDGNVQIDFESFKTVVDELGGVEIELNQAEADYLNLAYWQNGWTLTAGVQTLNGDQALAYSRIRQVGNSDFERTERQRTVLMTAFQKVKAQGKIKMLSLAKEIYPMLETDIGLKDMTSLGLTALSLSDGSIETYRLPVDGGFENQTIRNMAVLVPNLEMNQNYLKELLYGTATE